MTYPSTKGETLETDKAVPSGCHASSRPEQVSVKDFCDKVLITKNLTELSVQGIEKYRLFRYLFIFLRGVTVAACCSRLGPVGG